MLWEWPHEGCLARLQGFKIRQWPNIQARGWRASPSALVGVRGLKSKLAGPRGGSMLRLNIHAVGLNIHGSAVDVGLNNA